MVVIKDFDVALPCRPCRLRRFGRALLPRDLVHLLGIEPLSASVADPGSVTILELSGCIFVETWPTRPCCGVAGRWRGLCALGHICVRKAEVDLLAFAQLPFDLLIAKRCELLGQLSERISVARGHGELIFGGHVASACWIAGQMTWTTARRMVPTECGTAVRMGDFNCQLSIGYVRPQGHARGFVVCTASGTGLRNCLNGPGECFASSIRRWHAGAWSAILLSGRLVTSGNYSTDRIL